MKILVIGGGPGGYVAAIRAAQLGAEVVLVEKDKLGGTCLNVGCIPTKALLHSAEVYQTVKNAEQNGVSAEKVSLDFSRMQQRKSDIVMRMAMGVEGLLQVNKVKVIRGNAAFKDPHTVTITTELGEEEIRADKVIIAAGSVPSLPPIPGIDGKNCMDSTGALALGEIPASMVIIGGGVIGIEMASIYAALGAKITIVEMMDEILPMMDKELVKVLRGILAKRGIDIQTGVKVKSIEHQDTETVVAVDKEEQPISFKAEKVLVCIGRKANTNGLGLENAGIRTEYGKILVNEQLQTNVPGIYAVGDCRGGIMLAHAASAQGEIAAENCMGANHVYTTDAMPTCVYTDPEFAAVGLTAHDAAAKGLKVKEGRFPIMANGKSVAMGYTEGMIKMVADEETDRIIGVQILAPRATELIAECTLAITQKMTAKQLIDTIHAHPTISEAVREAALDADHRAIHMYRP